MFLRAVEPGRKRAGGDAVSDWLTPEQKGFFDRLDETPTRRAGGYVISVHQLKQGKGEYRSTSARFPRLKRCKARLARLRAMYGGEE